MIELNLDQLKEVSGGVIEYDGKQYTAKQLMQLYKLFGPKTVINFVQGALAEDPGLAQQIKDTFAEENIAIPEDIAVLLG